MIRDDIILEDTTLRDGEQSPGVAFDKTTKLAIFDLLVTAGVRWIEGGIPVMGGEELDTLREMLDRKPNNVTLVAWNRGVREDIALSLDLGFTAVHVGLPTSNIHLKDSLAKDRKWLLRNSADLIAFAKDRNAFVSVSAEDIARTEISFLQEYAGWVHEAGADRLRMSDTIGIMTPEQYGEKIAAVASAVPIDLMCHTHNDLGLATANTLAGLRAGARYFHVTVNGIGERAGMSDIAQVAFALRALYGHNLGIDGRILKQLARELARVTRAPLPPWYPIVGENVFSHESGIHVKGMLKNGCTFEPIPPEEVGETRRYVLGKHSGRANVRFALEMLGIQADENAVNACLDQVRATAIRQAGAVSTDQLRMIYENIRP
jgi:homocitrate synthase NifV